MNFFAIASRIAAQHTAASTPPKVARLVSDYLNKINVPHVLAGGLAVQKYSPSRTTKDVDFFIKEGDAGHLEKLRKAVEKKYGPVVMTSGFAMEADLPVRSITIDGIEVDFLLLPIDVTELADNSQNPVLSVNGLILYKLMGGREKDLKDIRSILRSTTESDFEDLVSYIEDNRPDLVDTLRDAWEETQLMMEMGREENYEEQND